MKIVIAPDSFKESLSALQVAQAVEAGFRQHIPHADYVLVPIADGGEGTVQAMLDACQGQRVDCRVLGPLSHIVDAHYGLITDEQGESCAVIEMASASGLHHLSLERRDPCITTSFGTGELIRHALDQGIRHIILGLGGSATNDAGAGMMHALGVRFLDKAGHELSMGGAALAQLSHIDLSHLHPAIADCNFEVACDVDNPLCGPEGATRVFGPQKGATATMLVQLDHALEHYALRIIDTGIADFSQQAGAGAAGGMGLSALAFLNAKLSPGIDIVTHAVGLADKLAGADLVITGEGRIDEQTIHGKAPIGVARIAQAAGVPVIAFAGCLGEGADLVKEHGIAEIYAVTPEDMPLAEALATASDNVQRCAQDVAAQWLAQH